MKRTFFLPVSFFLILSFSCHSAYRSEHIQYAGYRINKNTGQGDSVLLVVMKPYADSINKRMNVVLGENDTKLDTRRQQNTLGFFMADAYLYMANRKSGEKAVAAFMNRGGIRLPELPAGPITMGKIYELMPFDNLMLLVKIKGSELKQYLDTLAATEAIIQSGLTIRVQNKKVQEVFINAKPMDLQAEYLIVQSDYVVNTTPMLKKLNNHNTAYLLRDAIMDYVILLNEQGKRVTVANTDRVIYAE